MIFFTKKIFLNHQCYFLGAPNMAKFHHQKNKNKNKNKTKKTNKILFEIKCLIHLTQN
jgi:hypothetical protein